MASSHLNAIFKPQSIAVVGASNKPRSVGNAIISNLLGTYKGTVYPVHPYDRAIMGVHAYKTLEDLPVLVDMVVVAVPTNSVKDVIRTAGQLGIKGAVIITAGFKEVGAEGLAREQEVKQAARETGIAVVGPNCLGVINASHNLRMNASFATKIPHAGNIAFMSQSGALCTAVMDEADRRKMGFSKFISFGNKVDITECDILKFLRDDEETRVICMYLEEISDCRAFMSVARDVAWAAGKPMVAIKSGTSAEGRRAAASHTGALAGSERAYDAIFRQSGIMRVETISELFDSAQALSLQPIPAGPRMAIITNAGGPGIIATDALERHGLELAALSDVTVQKLQKGLPSCANTHNPVDIIGDARHDRYQLALAEVLADENVDGVVVILTPQAMTDVLACAEVIPPLAKQYPNKPVLSAFMGAEDVQHGVDHLQAHSMPNYTFPEAAVRALAAMVRFASKQNLQGLHEPPRLPVDVGAARSMAQGLLGSEAKVVAHQAQVSPLLKAYGLPVLENRLVAQESELDAALEVLGFPVAMKISSPDIVHKSDAGGVRINVKSAEEARTAYRDILSNARAYNPDARIHGVYLERMGRKGVEVIIGATRDPKFGPMVMFGLGGIFVEVIEDVTFRLAPMWKVSCENMIREVKAIKLLRGLNGRPKADVAAIAKCIYAVAQLLVDVPEISELDVNPLIVYEDGLGAVVADCRIMLQREE